MDIEFYLKYNNIIIIMSNYNCIKKNMMLFKKVIYKRRAVLIIIILMRINYLFFDYSHIYNIFQIQSYLILFTIYIKII